MTPALLFALEQQHEQDVAMLTLPTDKLGWMYANANRDPGEKDGDRVVRPPAPPMELDLFRTYGRHRKTLAAKDGWDSSLLGARADRGAWEAWGGASAHVEYVPVKET